MLPPPEAPSNRRSGTRDRDLDYDAEGIENPGIGYSRGAMGEDIEATEGDVLNDTKPDGSIAPRRRGRTNK